MMQELSEREGRAPHLMFHYLSSKVFLSFSLRAPHLMFHYTFRSETLAPSIYTFQANLGMCIRLQKGDIEAYLSYAYLDNDRLMPIIH